MMESVLRHRAATVIAASMLAFGLAACGSGTPQEPKSLDEETSKGDNQSDQDGQAGNRPDTSQMPTITLARSGGFAGYQDKLVISSSGTAKLTSGSKKPFTCDVEPTILTGLAKNATDVPKPKLQGGGKSTPTTMPDQINMSLKIDGQHVRKEKLAEGDTRWEALFSASGRVLSSALALRDGKQQPDELACTRS